VMANAAHAGSGAVLNKTGKGTVPLKRIFPRSTAISPAD